MKSTRRMELLIYAFECFQHGTSPFETRHLTIKDVTADECKELTEDIANILFWEVMGAIGTKKAQQLHYEQEKVFQKSQEEPKHD